MDIEQLKLVLNAIQNMANSVGLAWVIFHYLITFLTHAAEPTAWVTAAYFITKGIPVAITAINTKPQHFKFNHLQCTEDEKRYLEEILLSKGKYLTMQTLEKVELGLNLKTPIDKETANLLVESINSLSKSPYLHKSDLKNN